MLGSTKIVSTDWAGTCQLRVMNPMEIVMIRMQIQGKIAKKKDFWNDRPALELRDISFGAIYFSVYAAACMNHFVRKQEGS